ncbi:hypothetical protein TSUD_206980 [Trifolium subterraneum]|uniref:Uncharacterized protein n=1 Tax=Trifolium subterraneum TaxID=3900 RepID=A0A2Z6NLH0_TRISU|nr:hypothetical protein TSUD_206980 [Trifolium subterraneum]
MVLLTNTLTSSSALNWKVSQKRWVISWAIGDSLACVSDELTASKVMTPSREEGNQSSGSGELRRKLSMVLQENQAALRLRLCLDQSFLLLQRLMLRNFDAPSLHRHGIMETVCNLYTG